MSMFTDTITLFHKLCNGEWDVIVVEGVQWADKAEKKNESGKLSVVRYAQITFPEGTYDGLPLFPQNSEDCIVYGSVDDRVSDVKGHRISDLMKKYQKSGLIQSVNDNSNRDFLKNIKVVVA